MCSHANNVVCGLLLWSKSHKWNYNKQNIFPLIFWHRSKYIQLPFSMLLISLVFKSTCTRKVSFFFHKKFFFFICASHGFCMQKLSFLTKYELILLSLDRIMAKKPFSAFFENFCSFCPRFIFSDARSFPKTSKGCILSI